MGTGLPWQDFGLKVAKGWDAAAFAAQFSEATGLTTEEFDIEQVGLDEDDSWWPFIEGQADVELYSLDVDCTGNVSASRKVEAFLESYVRGGSVLSVIVSPMDKLLDTDGESAMGAPSPAPRRGWVSPSKKRRGRR